MLVPILSAIKVSITTEYRNIFDFFFGFILKEKSKLY